MTEEEIKEKLKKIENNKDDFENAHDYEDELYSDFIEFISKESSIPEQTRDLAKLILSSKKIKFPRHGA